MPEELSKMKPQVYKDPRPPEYFERFYERPARGRPDWVYELVRVLLTPYLLIFFRARCIDSDKIPVEGPAIITPNHFSFLDHFFVAVYSRRKVHFMAKSQLFKRPMQFIYTHGGVFPVRRGQRDTKSMEVAKTILGRGDLVVMYAEGGRSRSGELGEAKPGVGKLALETGVPVVPTAIVGTERARNWKKLQFPKVTVQYGDPLRFEKLEGEPSREQAQEAADVVFAEIKNLHGKLREADGRKKAIAAARAARRAAGQAAEAATRTPDPAR
jgi:1-acyl-sn-glycerol-3-phosphate acyltransferase